MVASSKNTKSVRQYVKTLLISAHWILLSLKCQQKLLFADPGYLLKLISHLFSSNSSCYRVEKPHLPRQGLKALQAVIPHVIMHPHLVSACNQRKNLGQLPKRSKQHREIDVQYVCEA